MPLSFVLFLRESLRFTVKYLTMYLASVVDVTKTLRTCSLSMCCASGLLILFL
jgi:hypothetical protein